MAQVNPRHVDAVMELINRSPYFELLGIRLTALSEGACTVEAVLERKHLNAFGGAHGGAYASLLDCAAYQYVHWFCLCRNFRGGYGHGGLGRLRIVFGNGKLAALLRCLLPQETLRYRAADHKADG